MKRSIQINDVEHDLTFFRFISLFSISSFICAAVCLHADEAIALFVFFVQPIWLCNHFFVKLLIWDFKTNNNISVLIPNGNIIFELLSYIFQLYEFCDLNWN